MTGTTDNIPEVGIRITLTPNFPIRVHWQCTDNVTNTIIDSGSWEFPASATLTGRDIKRISPDIVNEFGPGVDFKSFTFTLLESQETLQSDPLRPSYELFSPTSLRLEIGKAQARVIEGEDGEDGLAWWIIVIIVGAALIIIAACGYLYWQQTYKTEEEKERANQAEGELDRVEQGQYFDVPENQRNANPLYAANQNQVQMSSGTNANFEMINDGGNDEKFEIQATQFDQRQLEDRGGTETGAAPPTGPVAYRM